MSSNHGVARPPEPLVDLERQAGRNRHRDSRIQTDATVQPEDRSGNQVPAGWWRAPRPPSTYLVTPVIVTPVRTGCAPSWSRVASGGGAELVESRPPVVLRHGPGSRTDPQCGHRARRGVPAHREGARPPAHDAGGDRLERPPRLPDRGAARFRGPDPHRPRPACLRVARGPEATPRPAARAAASPGPSSSTVVVPCRRHVHNRPRCPRARDHHGTRVGTVPFLRRTR